MAQVSIPRGAAGRAAFLDSFETEDERREHMRAIGQRGNANRLVLSGEEKAALTAAYSYIGQIMRRHGLDESGASDG